MSYNIVWQNTPTKNDMTRENMFDNTKRFCLRPLVPMIWQLAGRAREPPLFAVNCRIHGTPPLSLNRVPQTLNRALPLSHPSVPCTAPQTRASSAPEAKSIIKPVQVGALQNPQVEPIWGRALPMRDCWRMMWMCLNFQIFQGRHSGIVCGLSLPRIVTFLSNLWVRRDIPGDGGSGGMSSSDLVSPEPRSRGRW